MASVKNTKGRFSMKYTMRLNGRLMTDVKITVSLTHEQVFTLSRKAKQQGLDLKTYLKRFVEIDEIDEESEE